jgi:hypothetical protein
MTRRHALLILAAGAAALLVVRPWPGAPKNRVAVEPDGGGPGWDVYLAGGATKEEGERLGRFLVGAIKLTNGRGGAAVLERPNAGGVVVALLLDPDEAEGPGTALRCGPLREELAREVFPGEPVALQICRGPMVFGPGDVPARDVVQTLRETTFPVRFSAPRCLGG